VKKFPPANNIYKLLRIEMTYPLHFFLKREILLLLFFIKIALPFSQFTNYNSPISINDILINNSDVWAATRGGLMHINLLNNKVDLETNVNYIPDLNLTALSKGFQGNIWIGSKKGYLCKLSSKGRYSVYTSYVSSEWDINDIHAFGKYLIIASSKGCSIFDIDKNRVFQNAIFESNVVHSLMVFKDTLFMGCDKGVYKLDISGDNIEKSNLNDEAIWEIEPTDSVISSFPIINDSIYYISKVAASWKNSLLYSVDTMYTDVSVKSSVFSDTVRIADFPSKLNSITVAKNGDCWYGTEENYLYRQPWHGGRWHYYTVNGLTFRSITKVHIADNGTVWCIPSVTWLWLNKELRYKGHPWWIGIAALKKDTWELYTPENTNNFPFLGDGDGFLGIGEDPFGNMWFGTNGSNVRRYHPRYNNWHFYLIGTGAKSTFLLLPENAGFTWGKCDAIARDSSGYMWFATYNSDPGSVFCYNPEVMNPGKSDYRFFFPKDSLEAHMKIPRSLNVDVAGNIFLGGDTYDDGKLVVFSHTGDPLKEDVTRIFMEQGLLKVNDMSSSSDSCTWIASGNGLYHFQLNNPGPDPLIKVNEAPVGITTVEVEKSTRIPFYDDDGYPIKDSASIETKLWVGTQIEGIHRLSISKITRQDGTLESCKIDTVDSLKEKDGLVSNEVTHLAIDRKNGCLWIATRDGLSKYSLGHSFEQLSNNKKISAYPNPFVRSRHNEVIFENLAPQSSISIYTVDGRLIKYLVASGKNVIKTESEWTIIWKPDPDILPGTYLYTAKIQQENEKQRSKRVVGKLLILP
jgi:ligand-binding sensor domain-containing protein